MLKKMFNDTAKAAVENDSKYDYVVTNRDDPLVKAGGDSPPVDSPSDDSAPIDSPSDGFGAAIVKGDKRGRR